MTCSDGRCGNDKFLTDYIRRQHDLALRTGRLSQLSGYYGYITVKAIHRYLISRYLRDHQVGNLHYGRRFRTAKPLLIRYVKAPKVLMLVRIFHLVAIFWEISISHLQWSSQAASLENSLRRRNYWHHESSNSRTEYRWQSLTRQVQTEWHPLARR